jgi:hypothetical protein
LILSYISVSRHREHGGGNVVGRSRADGKEASITQSIAVAGVTLGIWPFFAGVTFGSAQPLAQAAWAVRNDGPWRHREASLGPARQNRENRRASAANGDEPPWLYTVTGAGSSTTKRLSVISLISIHFIEKVGMGKLWQMVFLA